MDGKVAMLFELPLKLVRVNTPQGLRTLVVIHEAGADFAGGLRPEQILGSLRVESQNQAEIRADNFLPNRPFVEFLQGVIAEHGPSVEGLAAAAKAQDSGWVYVLDGRTPTPREAVPPEISSGASRSSTGGSSWVRINPTLGIGWSRNGDCSDWIRPLAWP